MTLDRAREAAAEAGFIRPNADINELLDAVTSQKPTYRISEAADEANRAAGIQQTAAESHDRFMAGANIKEAASGLGVRLSPEEEAHATELHLHGADPVESVHDAVRAGDEGVFQRNAEHNAVGAPGVPLAARQAEMSVGTPQVAAHFGEEAAGRYAAARQATLERKTTFGQGGVGAAVRPGTQGAEFRIESAAVPKQFLTGNSVEPARVQKYIEAVGGAPQAVTNMRDALVSDLRQRGIVQPDGTIKPDAYANWIQRRGRTIDMFSGLRDQLADVAKAQGTLDTATAAHTGAVKEFQNGVAKSYLNDDEPLVAVRKAFSSGNPTNTFQKLADLVKGDPDAEAGLRRGVVDYIMERHSSTAPSGTSGVDFLKADGFRRWIRENRGPLRVLFGGQGAQNLDMVAADLRRQAQKATATAGSDTQANRIATGKLGLTGPAGHAAGLGAVSMLTFLGERLGEMVGGHNILGAIAIPAAGVAIHALRQAGISTTNDLVRQAMLHPELARVLMQKVENGQIGPVAQRRLATALQSAVLADQANQGEKRQ